jgi:hypothetical protein
LSLIDYIYKNDQNKIQMKKLVLSLLAVALYANGAKAQAGTAPDMGFEGWHPIAAPFITTEDPNGWASLNALAGPTPTPLSVTKETSSPAVGAITAKITTVKISGATIPNPYGGTLDTAGILAVGSIALPSTIKYGFTYTAKPTMLSFQSKYTPNGSDSAFVLAYLTHWNGTGRDTIATGKYATGATTSAYATNSLTMTYDAGFPGVNPDSVQIFISSSVYSHDGAKVGSAFWIDALVWSAFVSVEDLNALENNVKLYPNPANNVVTIESSVDVQTVQVIDITGRVVVNTAVHSNKFSLETAALAPGTYIYQVLDKDKIILGRGKFDITR